MRVAAIASESVPPIMRMNYRPMLELHQQTKEKAYISESSDNRHIFPGNASLSGNSGGL
jgi:hypothetical protein